MRRRRNRFWLVVSWRVKTRRHGSECRRGRWLYCIRDVFYESFCRGRGCVVANVWWRKTCLTWHAILLNIWNVRRRRGCWSCLGCRWIIFCYQGRIILGIIRTYLICYILEFLILLYSIILVFITKAIASKWIGKYLTIYSVLLEERVFYFVDY